MGSRMRRPETDRPNNPQRMRKFFTGPFAAAAMLALVLLLGGCVRFGPQADEMEKTASQSEASKGQEQSEQHNTAADTDSSSLTESDDSQNEETQVETGNSDDSAADKSQSDNGTSSPTEPEIEASIDRSDMQSMITVNLKLLPQGYSLVGMSWEPAPNEPTGSAGTGSTSLPDTPSDNAAANGGSEQPSPGEGSSALNTLSSNAAEERVTTSYHDAILAGQSGSNGFFIDQNGQRIGYRYTPQQKGTSGTLRLEFRDSDGGAVNWEERLILGTAASSADESVQ